MATKTTILALASAAAALATAASSIAEELGGGNASAASETTTTTAPPEGKKRGRPAAPSGEDKPEYKTLDELKEIIAPLVKDSRGADIKKLLKDTYGVDGMKDLPGEKQAAFLKDIEALSI